MTHSEFVHLHNHTEYSLLDGACKIVDDQGKPAELLRIISHQFKMPALAITDHGNMYGAIEFYRACHEVGVKPIIGCELYVANGSRFKKEKSDRNYFHLTLLAKNNEGYKNLMKLSSLGFLEGFYHKPRVDKELLAKYSSGLIALSGCLLGEVAQSLLADNKKNALKIASEYSDIFGKENFYIELMDNGIDEQKKIIPGLLEIAKVTGLSPVATNDCHFLRKEDSFDHDVLLCIGTNSELTDENRMKFSTNQFYYRSPQEMTELFSFEPRAIKSTMEIADKVALEIKFDQILLPHYPLEKNETPDIYLEKLCQEGLKTRYLQPTAVHQERLKYELSVINKMNFASYFLIVWDFINYAKQNGIPVGPGRGSGAGSIVSYTLGITDICPIKYGLLFERFLNPDRRSMPDLDIDFADTGRERVIEYVRNKYGQRNCAQIITFGSMQARLVIRDVARVMGFTPAESNKIAKLIPFGANIFAATQSVPEIKALISSDQKIKKLFETAKKLEGLKRHTGVHAAGMIIAKEEITNYAPLAVKSEKNSENEKNIVVTSQYNDESMLALGLLKVDFLGLRTLTIIDDTIKLLKQSKEPNFSWQNVSLDDTKTFRLFHEAKTMGVFQLESRGMRDLMYKLKPTNINDIIALISLYRPGPMGAGMLDDFVSRKHGKTAVVYDHPMLEPILKDTYGIILYQEQVMRIARDVAGFSAGQADTLRKAMGKKIPDVIEKQRENFINGAKSNNITPKLGEKLFEQIMHFGGYGFNKSHAAAYGIIAYRTAYLKANYPLEYMTAVLNSEIGRSAVSNEEENKLVGYLRDAESLRIEILPPDIQASDVRFSTENGKIRFGLLAIKNVGEAACLDIISERNTNGAFKSWNDFISRVGASAVSKKTIESLIKAGALDTFGSDYKTLRAELFAKIEDSIDALGSKKDDISSGQGFLFEAGEVTLKPSVTQNAQAWSEHNALSYEKEVLGFYLSGHPLANHMQDIVAYSHFRLDKIPTPTADPRTAPLTRVAGIITSVKKLATKQGKEPYARFKLEDPYGEIEVVAFPKSYARLMKYITPNNLVVVKGKLAGDELQPELLLEDIKTLKEAKVLYTPNSGALHIKLSSAGLEDEMLEKVSEILKKYPGKSKVVFDIDTPGHGSYTVETDFSVTPEANFFKAIEKALGPECWQFQRSK